MRSLLLRWGVAVVGGTLWGAILSPAAPVGSRGTRPTSSVCDAAHYAQSTKSAQWFAASGENNPKHL